MLRNQMGSDSLHRHKVTSLATAESTLHSIEILGCIFSTVSALAHGEVRLALWSLSALLTSALALYLLHRRRDLYLQSSLRDWLYAGMRLHRACAIVGMRRVLTMPLTSSMMAGSGSTMARRPAGDRVYFAKAVLVNSSILPILLQSLVLQLPLTLQAAVQVAVAAVVVRAMPAYCSTLAADGVQPSQFQWLARLQGYLSSIVMAATSSSHGVRAAEEVPCAVSLSHLVVVFEVIVPCLFTYYFNVAASHWFANHQIAQGEQGPSSSGGSGGSPPAAAAGRRSDATSSRGLVLAASADAPATGGNSGQGSAVSAANGLNGLNGLNTHARALPQRQAVAAGTTAAPSALLVLLFALGLSGVLFDVVLTMHSRRPLLLQQ